MEKIEEGGGNKSGKGEERRRVRRTRTVGRKRKLIWKEKKKI